MGKLIKNESISSSQFQIKPLKDVSLGLPTELTQISFDLSRSGLDQEPDENYEMLIDEHERTFDQPALQEPILPEPNSKLLSRNKPTIQTQVRRSRPDFIKDLTMSGHLPTLIADSLKPSTPDELRTIQDTRKN